MLVSPCPDRGDPVGSFVPTQRGLLDEPARSNAVMPLLRSDPELLSAFREGKRAALETVYRHYVRSIDVYVRALARGTGVAELRQASVVQDLLQEVFIRAFSQPARRAYDDTRDFAPYLKTIARNCFIDVLRKRKDEITFVPDDGFLAVEELSLGEESYDREVLATLDAYLRQLSPELRGVYEERFERGLSQAAASERLGLSRRTLRTLETHLRRGLRKSLLLAGLLQTASHFPLAALEPSRE
jgi:RNA polymerase sigma factor (sigma-70 family)